MEIEVGILYRGAVRRYLEEAEFYGHIESWKEVKSLLGSKFLVRKPSAAVLKDIREWVEKVA